jgi:hypothetical protein
MIWAWLIGCVLTIILLPPLVYFSVRLVVVAYRQAHWDMDQILSKKVSSNGVETT